MGIQDKFKDISRRNIFLGIIIALPLGFYDGFLGDVVGSFLIFGLIKVFGFDFSRACGNSKSLNFIDNVVAVFIFAMRGQINYKLGIPIALFMILGAKIGTKVALDNGAKLIKPIFVIMSLSVAIKVLYGVVK